MQNLAGTNGRLDWCDQLAALSLQGDNAPPHSWAAVSGSTDSVVLVVRIASLVEAIVVEGGAARTSPAAATRILTDAVSAEPATIDRTVLLEAFTAAAPLIKARLAAVEDARWRAGDRDRFARRLIPWVLSAARRAARRGDGDQLATLDALVSRLALGMTAGEEFLLDELLSQREPLTVNDLLAWHIRLPPGHTNETTQSVELVAAMVSTLA